MINDKVIKSVTLFPGSRGQGIGLFGTPAVCSAELIMSGELPIYDPKEEPYVTLSLLVNESGKRYVFDDESNLDREQWSQAFLEASQSMLNTCKLLGIVPNELSIQEDDPWVVC